MVSLDVSQCFQPLGVSSLMSSVCPRLLAIIVSVACPYLSVRKCNDIVLWPFWRFDVLAFASGVVLFAVCLLGFVLSRWDFCT